MPLYRLQVADRATGKESSIELEADSEEAAVRDLGARGYLIESSRALGHIPYATAVPGRKKRWFYVHPLLIPLALLGLFALVALPVGIVQWLRSPPPPPFTLNLPPPPQLATVRPAVSGPELTVTKRWFINGLKQDVQTVFEILSTDNRAITITDVRFNNRISAAFAIERNGEFVLDPRGRGVRTIGLGDKLLLWKDDVKIDHPSDFTGVVFEVAIYTDLGVSRHSFGQ